GYGGFGKMFGFRAPKVDKLTLFADRGRLRAKVFPPPDMEDMGPAFLLTLLRRVATEDLYPSRKVFRGLVWIGDNAPAAWFSGPQAGEFLMSVLKHERSERALRVLLRAGILEKMIPEFAAITDLCQFDRYHRYSVDEHTLKTVGGLEDIPEAPGISQELRSLYRQSDNLPVIKLALLLHDVAKRAEDHHAEDDCGFVGPILGRLGLERLHDRVYFLVKNHLAMSRTAQRLNINDAATLKMFCDTVENRENLKMLYLLTHSDITAVGPEIWSEWKDRLLLSLYELAVKFMIEGEAVFVSGPEQEAALAKRTAEQSGRFSAEEVLEFLKRAPDKYVQTATPEAITSHMTLAGRASGGAVAMEFRTNPGDMTGEFTIAFAERAGALSIISGAFAAKDIDIVEMIAHTFSHGIALDTIIARGAIAPYSDREVAANFERELNGIMNGTRNVAEMIKRRTRYLKDDSAAVAHIEPRVSLLNNLSENNTVVEIMAPDRLGLLHGVTSAMAGMGLNIESAKIVTRGKLAVNVFYVTKAGGGKVVGEEAERQVAQGLLSALMDQGLTSP
ncbi:MAG: hypothetical protein OEV92_12340, partial [Nitrospinota bacterium]|nr:hypothetical protein [Nitrospinota bacterium]